VALVALIALALGLNTLADGQAPRINGQSLYPISPEIVSIPSLMGRLLGSSVKDSGNGFPWSQYPR